jgi:hypothetical protein
VCTLAVHVSITFEHYLGQAFGLWSGTCESWNFNTHLIEQSRKSALPVGVFSEMLVYSTGFHPNVFSGDLHPLQEVLTHELIPDDVARKRPYCVYQFFLLHWAIVIAAPITA